MPRKRKNIYFTEDTENKIQDYIKETSQVKKELLYLKHLQKPIRTIVEVYHSKINTPYIEESREDIINDCITSLMTDAIFKLNNKKGKAFSYLSICARNFFIQKNNRSYVKVKNKKYEPISEDNSYYYVDEWYDKQERDNDFRKKYYGFIEWARKNIDNISTHKITAEKSLLLLDYMENFDTDSYFKKDVLKELSERYGLVTATFDSARILLQKSMLYYFNYVDKYDREPLFIKSSFDSSFPNLDKDKINFIKTKFRKHCHQYGTRGLALRFNVTEDVIHYYLTK
jgi:hypothetical protein